MQTHKYFRCLMVLLSAVLLITACKKNDNGPATYVTDKKALESTIDSLTAVLNKSVEGTKPGQYAVGAKAALDSSISLAKQVDASSAYTQQQVNNALNNLLRAGQAFQSQLLQDVSAANLMAFWKFNGNANDSSGHGNNGTLKTGWIGTSATSYSDGGTLPVLTADRFSRAGMAYYFNNGAYIEVPYSPDLNPQNFTISLWLRRDGSSNGNYMVSLNRWNGYKFQLQGSNLPFLTVSTDKGTFDVDDGGVSIDSANVWRYVAVSYTSGTMKFYVQGNLVKTAAINGAPVKVSSTVNLSIGNELPKNLYNFTDATSPNYFWGASYFMGALDDIRFYNTTLTDAEIKSIYVQESSL